MSQPLPFGLLAFTACLCCAAAVRGDRSAGIDADLAVDRALRTVESQNARQSELSGALHSLHERERALRSTLRDHVRALYRITRSGTSPIAGGFDAMRMHLSRVRRLKSLVEHDIAAVAALRSEQDATQKQTRQAERALAAAQDQLTTLHGHRAATARNTAPTRSPGTDHGFYGLRLTSGKSVSGFEQLHGKLAAPLSGELRLREVRRGNGSALLFEAPAGSVVRAVARGRVVVSDSNRVVVDHGDGYQTAYGQLSNVDVRVGDDVSGSARLGNIADGSATPALLFEIRRSGKRVSARAWLGL